MSFKEEMQKLSFENGTINSLIQVIKDNIRKEAEDGDTTAIIYLWDDDYSEYDIQKALEYFKQEEEIEGSYREEESWINGGTEHARWRIFMDWWN